MGVTRIKEPESTSWTRPEALVVSLLVIAAGCTTPSPSTNHQTMNTPRPTFLGLRTAIYHAPDISKAKSWYSKVLGIEPSFVQPFYVGFNVSGFELGLDPDKSSTPGGNAGVIVYWGVPRLEAALEHLVSHGATRRGEIQDVGGGIKLATVFDPFGNILGVIENPQFSIEHP
jgi:predicted enzyme related to lactoylglutathione lyase